MAMKETKPRYSFLAVVAVAIFLVCCYWAAMTFLWPHQANSIQRIMSLDRVGWAGINWHGVEPAVLAKLQVPGAVEIHQVATGGPADQAGLKPGDYLVGVDGKPFSDVMELQGNAKDYVPGRKIVLNVVRGDEQIDLPVTLATYAEVKELPNLSGLAL
jgi:C-terminal processing protease CtpA/Prc